MRGAELVPAVIAAGGGAALLGGIALHEARRDTTMRASRRSYALTFPLAAKPEAALSALRSLSGLGSRIEIVVEVVADEKGIRHLVHLPEGTAASVIDQLTGALPGLRIDATDITATGPVSAAARVVVPVQALLRTDDVVAASRSLLLGMAALRDGERVSLRWALRPSAAPAVAHRRSAGSPSLAQRSQDQAWRARVDQPGFVCTGLILARATSIERATRLVSHGVSVLRSRRGVGGGLVLRRGSLRSQAVMPRTGRSRGWLSAGELLPILAWPLGAEPVPGVKLGAARRLAVPRGVARDGRPLFVGSDAYGERTVALTALAARHHLAVLGPSGVGKSWLLARGILSDIERGFGGIVIDPKGPDLVDTVLDRVPREHADRIVVLDPAAGCPLPGLNLLSIGDPDLRSDVVLGVLGAIYRDSFGVRTQTYLRLGLRTLAQLDAPVLTDWMRLFTDRAFRRSAVSRLSDPMLLAAWQSYEAMSAAEQNQHVAAPMAKVIALLSRPSVRGVLAQSEPKLDVGRLLGQRKWLFVSLSPGQLGQSAAQLLAAVLTYAAWSAVEGRAAVPVEKRKSVWLYVDELASLAALPFGLEHLFERARGLGCGVTVATQTLGRLPESLRSALVSNVGSLVAFRQGHDEAARIARELPGLDAADLQALQRFEVAARVSTGAGSSVAVMTGRAEALGALTGQAVRIRALSAERYGQRLDEIDAALRREHHSDIEGDEPPVGRQRRAS